MKYFLEQNVCILQTYHFLYKFGHEGRLISHWEVIEMNVFLLKIFRKNINKRVQIVQIWIILQSGFVVWA